MKYKTNDGWDLNNIEPLKNVVDSFNEMNQDIYELENCRRTKTLKQMRDSLIVYVEEIQEALKDIDDEDTVYEED